MARELGPQNLGEQVVKKGNLPEFGTNQEDAIILVEQADGSIFFDGKKILLRGLQQKQILKELAEAGKEGLTRNQFAQTDIDAGVDPELAYSRIRTNICNLRKNLKRSGLSIPVHKRRVKEEQPYILTRQLKLLA